MTEGQYKVAIDIPFLKLTEAEIAYNVLRVDVEPKRSYVTKEINLEDNVLKIVLEGELAKNVRVGLTSFFKSLILCCETISKFGPPAEKYDYY